ncbi:MAG TPA: hypothetical protein VGB49_07445 [Caulobacteraceae bacterium]|jgi:hypothetical protein
MKAGWVLLLALGACDRGFDSRVDPTQGWHGLRFAVAAAPDVEWTMECRFRAVRPEAGGTMSAPLVNTFKHSRKGPLAGRLPGPDGRCEVTPVDEGRVTLALYGDAETKTAAADRPGQTARTFIWAPAAAPPAPPAVTDDRTAA